MFYHTYDTNWRWYDVFIHIWVVDYTFLLFLTVQSHHLNTYKFQWLHSKRNILLFLLLFLPTRVDFSLPYLDHLPGCKYKDQDFLLVRFPERDRKEQKEERVLNKEVYGKVSDKPTAVTGIQYTEEPRERDGATGVMIKIR